MNALVPLSSQRLKPALKTVTGCAGGQETRGWPSAAAVGVHRVLPHTCVASLCFVGTGDTVRR